MNDTNPYLTEKALKLRKRNIPVFLFCVLFETAMVPSMMDVLSWGDTSTVVFMVLIFAAFLIPLVRIVRHIRFKFRARRIAETLLPLSVSRMSFDKLQSTLHFNNALGKLKTLIGKGYLRNMKIDEDAHTVLLLANGSSFAEASFVEWECPHCGARNRAPRNGTARCSYCDQLIGGSVRYTH